MRDDAKTDMYFAIETGSMDGAPYVQLFYGAHKHAPKIGWDELHLYRANRANAKIFRKEATKHEMKEQAEQMLNEWWDLWADENNNISRTTKPLFKTTEYLKII